MEYPTEELIGLLNRVVRLSDADKKKVPSWLALQVAYLLNAKVLTPTRNDKDVEFKEWVLLSGRIEGLSKLENVEKSVRNSTFERGSAFEDLMLLYLRYGYFDKLYNKVSNITDTGIGCYYMSIIKANGITPDGK